MFSKIIGLICRPYRKEDASQTTDVYFDPDILSEVIVDVPEKTTLNAPLSKSKMHTREVQPEDSRLIVLNITNNEEKRAHKIISETVVSNPRCIIDETSHQPVHIARKTFDKSNNIETCLPRYQVEGKSKKTVQKFRSKIPIASKVSKSAERQSFPELVFMNHHPQFDQNEDRKSHEKYEKDIENLRLKRGTRDDSMIQKGDSVESVNTCHEKVSRRNSTDRSHLQVFDPEKFSLESNKREGETLAKILTGKGSYGGGWTCHRCGRTVYHAERMLACGNAYHDRCFSCASCKKLLASMTYLEGEMEIYCKHCYIKNFGLTGYGYGFGPGVLQAL